MGHRANYAIRRGGVVELFYSHWGALTVPSDLFWGPEHADQFIRAHKQVDPDDWLDDVWCEGGAALDYDEKRITLFGGQALGHPPLRETFVGLMGALWRSDRWDVVWGDAGIAAIADAVGVDPANVISEPVPPFAVDLEQLGESFETDEPHWGCLISVVEDTSTRHLIGDSGIVPTLYAGEPLLEALDQLPSLDSALEAFEPPDYRDLDIDGWSLGDELTHSAIVRTEPKSIAYRDDFATLASTEFLAEKWEEWKVTRFSGSLHDHFDRLGDALPDGLTPRQMELSDPSEAELSEEAAIAEIAKYLIDTERLDLSEVVRRMTSDAEEAGKAVMVNANALEPPGEVSLDLDTRQALFGKAIALMKYLPR